MSQQRILELRSILDRLAYEYYVLDQPSKSDQEYDRYYQELVALEDEDVYKRQVLPCWVNSLHSNGIFLS